MLTAVLPAAAALLARNADGVDAGQPARGAKIAHMAVDLRREGVEGQEARHVERNDELPGVRLACRDAAHGRVPVRTPHSHHFFFSLRMARL